MKTVVLAGGKGSRISEESHLKPKPMIEIGEYPILVHIMKIYSHFGFNDFVICSGYKQSIIKNYFANFNLYTNDVTIDIRNKKYLVHHNSNYDWKITISDTGLKTETGGRIKRIMKYIGNNRFFLTYGDAVGNINIKEVLKSHIKSKKILTLCVYNFGQSKGVVKLNKKGFVESFKEKADSDGNLINIGFMVCEPKIFDYIKSDSTNFEKDVLEKLVKDNQINAYIHRGFWQCMDTMREKEILEKMWDSDNCPWLFKEEAK